LEYFVFFFKNYSLKRLLLQNKKKLNYLKPSLDFPRFQKLAL